MKKLIASLWGLLVIISLTAQTTTDVKTLNRTEKKEIQAQERAARKERMLQMINDRRFVIEAYSLEDRYGQLIQVTPTTNFVAVDSLQATIQLALPNRIGGQNGLGGITEDGYLHSLKFAEKAPKHGISFEMEITGPAFGSSHVFVDLNDDGLATVRFSGAFGARFQMRGGFKSLDNSMVFKGMARY